MAIKMDFFSLVDLANRHFCPLSVYFCGSANYSANVLINASFAGHICVIMMFSDGDE
jgi:hypothetical protein